MSTLQLDLKKVVQQKNAFLAKIPFFISWLKKLIHEQKINEFLRGYGHLHGIEFIAAVIDFFGIRLEVTTITPLQPQGRYIFAANHPLGGLDGMALIKVLSETYKEIRFPVNDILLAIENFQPIFLPINKHGKQGREVAEKINAACASLDQQVIMFPAGLVSRKIKGKIIDLPWQKNFISKAIEHKRDIVPVYIDGKNSNRFYRISNWRKRFGMPNIEMLYLSDEMFRQKNQTIKIIIGKPIPYDILAKSSAQSWADYVKSKVYQL